MKCRILAIFAVWVSCAGWSAADDGAALPAGEAKVPPAASEEALQAPALADGGCSDYCCWTESVCEPACRWWVQGEYLLWWIRRGPSPGPLLTTGSPSDPRPGVLGQPNTVVLYGQDGFDYRHNSGFRLMFGGAFGPCRRLGFEAGGFMLESHTTHCEANSDDAGTPLLARPRFNALVQEQGAFRITVPGVALGGIDIFSDSRLWGAESNVVALCVASTPLVQVDLLAGFRYLGLKDELRFSQSTTPLVAGVYHFGGDPVPVADIITIKDFYQTHNQFFGGQVGARVALRWGRLGLDGLWKVGVGTTWQEVHITGFSGLTNPDGVTQLLPGGLYALPTNIGYNARQRESVMTELGVRLAWNFTPTLAAHVGYTFLYWDDVARTGEQINLNINPTYGPTYPGTGSAFPVLPSFNFNASDFWAQGLSLGVAWRF